MKYYEVSINTTGQFADIVAETLIACGSGGVAIQGGSVAIEALQSASFDYYEEGILEGETCVLGYFFDCEFDDSLRLALERLRRDATFPCGTLDVGIAERDDSEWKDVWRQYYKPIDTDKLVIVPAWMSDHRSDKPQVLIEPGNAFGTGSHDTTLMCLKLLQQQDLSGKQVIDVGCGSGILGISAAVLGAKAALTDIDGDACRQAVYNATLNSADVRVREGGFFADFDGQFDVVIANLTAGLLIDALPHIKRHTRSGALLVMSGIINSRLGEVLEAYHSAGMRFVQSMRSGEWSALVLEV